MRYSGIISHLRILRQSSVVPSLKLIKVGSLWVFVSQ